MMMTPDAPAPDAGPAATQIAYVGGYGPNLTWWQVDRGTFSPLGQIAAAQPSPSFLAIAGGTVYAVSEAGNRVVAYTRDPALHYVDDQSSGGMGPAHLSVSGNHVLVANYTDGSIAVLPIRADHGVDAPTQVLAPGANAHMIVEHGGYVYVPCLGANLIAEYAFDGTLSPIGTLSVPGGPRHIAFDGNRAFLVTENASTVVALTIANGLLTIDKTVQTAPGKGAEIAVSNGYVYASIRGDDAIWTFDESLHMISRTPSGGQTPRSFAIDPSGQFLYVANQGSNNIVTFAIAGGHLTQLGSVSVEQPTFIGFP